jgi:hypothetical protein
MRRGRVWIGLASLIAGCTALVAPNALAATPQDICKDLQDGVVNGTYTAAEWTAFFQDPTVQGYCSPIATVTPPGTVLTPPAPLSPSVPQVAPGVQLPAIVAGVAGQRKTIVTRAKPQAKAQPQAKAKPQAKVLAARSPSKSSAAPLATTKKRGALPFTGAELALFALVGLALIASGLLLRTTARQRSHQS